MVTNRECSRHLSLFAPIEIHLTVYRAKPGSESMVDAMVDEMADAMTDDVMLDLSPFSCITIVVSVFLLIGLCIHRNNKYYTNCMKGVDVISFPICLSA